MSTTSPIRYSDIADRVEKRPVGGAHRRDCDPIVGGTARGGAHKAHGSLDGLALDAFEGASILAAGSGSWTAEQILVHPEIAALAADEARRDLDAAPSPKSSRGLFGRKDKSDSNTPGAKREHIDVAEQALADAHSQLTFVDA